ncbi:unnamed protein product [Moneuplotes crassus]|uniref:Uncharacterized protein n=1 Tax=Euplotes crassus TaxID=5936 RepID=A0AAD1XB19_EUPCR|nr:unnamed protein product [Moneuplotes crassus]
MTYAHNSNHTDNKKYCAGCSWFMSLEGSKVSQFPPRFASSSRVFPASSLVFGRGESRANIPQKVQGPFCFKTICNIDITAEQERVAKDANESLMIKQEMISEQCGSSMKKVFECPICYEVMDPDRAISSSCCGQTWCFQCILRILETSFICPNCKKNIKHQFLSRNRTLQSMYDIIKGLPKVKGICKIHSKKCLEYCKECSETVCITCAATSHSGHTIIEVLTEYTNIVTEFGQTKELSKSIIEKNFIIKEMIRYSTEKSVEIYDCIHEAINDSLNQARQEFDSNYISVMKDCIGEIHRHQKDITKLVKDGSKIIKEQEETNICNLLSIREIMMKSNRQVDASNAAYFKFIEEHPELQAKKHTFKVEITDKFYQIFFSLESDDMVCELKLPSDLATAEILIQSWESLNDQDSSYLVICKKEGLFKSPITQKVLCISKNGDWTKIDCSYMQSSFKFYITCYKITPALAQLIKTSFNSLKEKVQNELEKFQELVNNL